MTSRYRTGLRRAWVNRALARARWQALKPMLGDGRAELRRALRNAEGWRERRTILSNTKSMTKTMLVQLFEPGEES